MSSSSSTQTVVLTSIILLLSIFIQTTTSVVSKSAILTPSDAAADGVRLVKNFKEVQIINNEWSVDILSDNTWQFIISLDNTYGFDPSLRSLISITMHASLLDTTAMLFGFTTDNAHYVSMSIPLDHTARSNTIYPSCIPSTNTLPSFAVGDIAAMPNVDRKCDIAGGSCINWHNMVPPNHAYDTQMPITVLFEHFPAENLLQIYVEDSASQATMQQCTFGTGYTIDNGFKVYIAGANPTDTFTVSSFNVLSMIHNTIPATPTFVPNTPNVTPYKPLPTQAQVPVNTHPTRGTPALPAQVHRPLPTGFVWGAFGQLCEETVVTTGYCKDIVDVYHADNIACLEPYSCCMCSSIECGFSGAPCGTITLGPYAVYGVKSIRVAGDREAGVAGSSIDCSGVGSCESANIIAEYLDLMNCDGERACANATIIITDPKPNFVLECAGIESCSNLQIKMIFSSAAMCNNVFYMDKIICSSDRACEGAQITIDNTGCSGVVIDTFECVTPTACDGAVFNLIGDITIQHCECGPSCANAIGLEQCFTGLELVMCAYAHGCAYQSQTITNPLNGFEYMCSDVSSCEGANVVIQLTPDIPTPTTALAKFMFGGENAGKDATFVIDNRQGIPMSLDLIECGGLNSCAGIHFVLSNDVVIENIICAMDACPGCTVQQNPTAPALPCDSTTV